MTTNREVLDMLGDYYNPDVNPATIPHEIALAAGRLLSKHAELRSMIGIVTADSQLSIANLMHEFDDRARYVRDTNAAVGEADGLVVGPIYINDGEEFCPVGIGVWELQADSDETA